MTNWLTSRVRLAIVITGVVLVATACDNAAPTNSALPQPSDTPAPTGTALSTNSATRMPTGEPTPDTNLSLRIWWPDTLYPDNADFLDQQIREFVSASPFDVGIDFRRKRTQDVGGIMSTLRSASRVAPDALPDITLIRRQDLVSAAQENLIFPIDDLISNVVEADLYDSALALGEFQGVTYGLPYLVEVEHLAYRGDPDVEEPELNEFTFDEILDKQVNFVFAGGRANGVNNVFYVQYLDAGGTLPDADGTIQPNRDALLSILSFYENARRLGIVDERILEFSRVSDYQLGLVTGEYDAAVVDSTTFFMLRADENDLQAAYIPTESGSPIGVIGGWMWVITTDDADQQELAAEFIDWMMQSERQSTFAGMVNMLPSQQSVLQSLNEDLTDALLLDNILENAVLPLTDNNGGVFARAMQNAFVSVITGENTAEEATDAVFDQLAN